ncbi:MAG TPA: thiamine pyrophosphate-dependent dehydrogenase E1 component subunit alpha [Anaerolineae bacterium]|nr:thiamine pyrophosphate-dependent dehydrogenase E1 component subunit alpha [Anaerolineae bacterium]
MNIQIDILKKMYRLILSIRRFEERATEQYRLGNIRGYLHPYIGEEAIAVGAITALEPTDYITSTHRGHGHAIAKEHCLTTMLAELFGKATGYCKGRGGSMHVACLEQRNLGANGIVGAGIPIATGAGMAIKQKKGREVVLCFFSDGAINNGVFHESLNMAAIYHLPVIYIIENNHYAVTSPVEAMTLIKDLSVRATGYGIPGITIDGNDAVKVYETMQVPISRARKGEGPTLIECKTYRFSGHHVNDPGLYMPKEKLEYWKSKDPLIIMRKYLQEQSLTDKDIQAINAQVEKSIDEAVKFALESPDPSLEEFLQEIKPL